MKNTLHNFAINKFSPEAEFLIECTRTNADSTSPEHIKSITENINWQFFLELAKKNSIVPLIYLNMHSKFKNCIPDQVLLSMQSQYKEITIKNLFLCSEFLTIYKALKEEGIFLIAFKGPALAISLYNDPGLREYGDIDFIAKRNDIWKIQEILKLNDYLPEYPFDYTKKELFEKSLSEITFIRKKRPSLDIHLEVAKQYLGFQLDKNIWNNTRKINIAGEEINVLSLEDEILAQCINASKDKWIRLKNIVDITELLKKDVDWNKLIKKAEMLNCKNVLKTGTYLSKILYNTEIPSFFSLTLEKNNMLLLCNKIITGLFEEKNKKGNYFHTSIFHISQQDSFYHKMLFVKNFLFSPNIRDWEYINLPSSCRIFYPLVRILRLLVKYLKKRTQYEPHIS